MEASQTENGQIPLILIHGAWLSARSWEKYADYFGKRGFAVSAPEWPRKHGDVEELRGTAEASAGLGVQEIVGHYEQLIRELDQPPVLIGHSYGGLFVELLLDRGLGRAGVAMSPAPPKGILALPFSTLKAGAPALAHPSKWHGVVTLTPEEFTYAFVNTFSEDDAAAAYERYAVPETSLSQEFGPKGIRVNCVSPGQVSTDLWLGEHGVAAAFATATGVDADTIRETAASAIATGRFSTPQEVATLVTMLASDRTANVTGVNYVVDGGLIKTI